MNSSSQCMRVLVHCACVCVCLRSGYNLEAIFVHTYTHSHSCNGRVCGLRAHKTERTKVNSKRSLLSSTTTTTTCRVRFDCATCCYVHVHVEPSKSLMHIRDYYYSYYTTRSECVTGRRVCNCTYKLALTGAAIARHTTKYSTSIFISCTPASSAGNFCTTTVRARTTCECVCARGACALSIYCPHIGWPGDLW